MSSTRYEPVTFLAGEDLAACRRVKLAAGSGTNVVYADAGEAAIGVTLHAVGSGNGIAVSLIKAGVTHLVECAGAVSVGASLYGDSDGKVDDTGVGGVIGTALAVGSGSGSIIEAILDQDSALGLAHIADAAAETQTALTDNGGGTADGTVASQAAPTTLTDNTGGSGTHDDTLAAVTAPTLTDWNGSTVHPSAAQGTAITDAINALKQNSSDTAQKIIELVTLAGTARDNLKEVTTQLAAAKADNVALNAKITAILARLEAAGINVSS